METLDSYNRRIVGTTMVRWITFLFGGFVFLSACSPTEANQIPVGDVYFEVDHRFLEMYTALGGKEMFGPAISPKFTHQESEYQYTAAALFVFNPQLSVENQVSLTPIGLELDFAENNIPEEKSLKVYPGFLDLYASLGGVRTVGLPITNVQYNHEKMRIEQYFENLGFYQADTDPPEKIHLLHYGAWMCSVRCNFSSMENSLVSRYQSKIEPFINAINNIDPVLLGRPITNPYIAPDGRIQQIFHNVVLFSSPYDDSKFELRPVPAMLGIPTNPNEEYPIPDHFQLFIETTIGFELVGPAVTAYSQQSQNVFRQCFEKLCLNYFPGNFPAEQISPVPLGYLYRQKYFRESEAHIPDPQPEIQDYTINVWEDAPIAQPNSTQTIGVSIYRDGSPVSNLQAFLLLKLPENIKIRYSFPKTGENGTSTLSLNPIDAPHGTVIAYDVCVGSQGETSNCTNESYLIWGNP